MKTTRLIGTECKRSDPFSSCVLRGRGLDPIFMRYSICCAVRYSVLRVHPLTGKHGNARMSEKRSLTLVRQWPVSMTVRFHLFPFRTQKLSSLVPKIVGWRRPVKIGRCRLLETPYPARDRAIFVLCAKCRKYKRTPALASVAKAGVVFLGKCGQGAANSFPKISGTWGNQRP